MNAFRLLRHYAIASLVCIVIAAALLASMYRAASVRSVTRLAEKANLMLGHAVLSAVRTDLIDYLEESTYMSTDGQRRHALPAALSESVRELMRDSAVVRVKIYNSAGVVAFSTRTPQIGRDQHAHGGFVGAMDGRHVSTMAYRDLFNVLAAESDEDNLVQTYMPVRSSPTSPVIGVFEVYTDASAMVAQNERALIVLLAGALAVLLLLYAALLLVVRRADGIINSQQQVIQERSSMLETLAARMLRAEESQRRQLAHELREGLAQTLSAIKLNVELGALAPTKPGAQGAEPSSHAQPIVELLQSAIDETRSLATALRPASLDELGLAAAIRGHVREFEAAHPGIEVGQHLAVDESRLSTTLREVVFRIVESALRTVAQAGLASRVEVVLDGADESLSLTIGEWPNGSMAGALQDESETAETADAAGERFAEIAERTLQSGGRFAAGRSQAGGVALSASWSY